MNSSLRRAVRFLNYILQKTTTVDKALAIAMRKSPFQDGAERRP